MFASPLVNPFAVVRSLLNRASRRRVQHVEPPGGKRSVFPGKRKAIFEALEPRILLSGDPIGSSLLLLTDWDGGGVNWQDTTHGDRDPTASSQSAVVIDGLGPAMVHSVGMDTVAALTSSTATPLSRAASVRPAELGFRRIDIDAGGAAQFRAASPGLSIILDHDGARFGLASAASAGAQVVMTALGDNAPSPPVGIPSLTGAADAPSQTDAAQVFYDEVYAGIDLLYYQRPNGALEYDWVLAPQANPDSIRMSFSGAFGIEIEADGDLNLHTAAGDLVQQAPQLYQEVGGQRKAVDGRFVLRGGGPGSFEVGFDVGTYDPTLALVIDPILGYSTYLGGSRNEVISLTAADAAGNTYVLGTTDSPDLGGGAAPDDQRAHAFWAKYDAQGRQQYVHVVGGSADPGLFSETSGQGLALGADGTPYVLMRSYEFKTDLSGLQDVQLHLIALGNDGLPASDLVLLKSDTVFSPGHAVYDVGATGMTAGPDGGLYLSTLQLRATGGGGAIEDDFLIKVMPDAGIVFKQPLFQLPQGIKIDAEQHIYLAFSTDRTDLPLSENAIRAKAAGSFDSDIYLQALDPTATGILWATYLGGAHNDYLGGMTMDPAQPGVLYLAGSTASADFPMATSPAGVKTGFQTSLRPSLPARGGYTDGFLAVVDLPHMKLVSSTYLGGDDTDGLTGIALDTVGNVYVSGQSNSTDFPLANPLFGSYSAGAAIRSFAHPYDFVVAKLNATLGTLLFSTYIGGTGQDSAQDINIGLFGGPKLAVDAAGTVHVAGTSSSDDFPVLNAQQPDFAGGDRYPGFRFSSPTQEPSDGVLLTLLQRGSLLGVGVRATQGREIAPIVANFGNPRLNSSPGDFEPMIDWGDGTGGTPSLGSVARFADAPNIYQVSGTHTYDKPGAYPVLVTVRDRVEETLSPLTNQNLSHREGSQIGPAMAQDPTFLRRFVTVSTTEPPLSGSGPGIALAISENGGENWAPRMIADGNDKLPVGRGSPDVLFDAFGNLYIAYLGEGGLGVVLLSSKDGGKTFGDDALKEFSVAGAAPALSRPRLAWNNARNEVWLTFMDTESGELTVAAAPVTALGDIGSFVERTLHVGDGARAADIATGPEGGVAVVWEQPTASAGMQLSFVLDNDGLGDAPFTPVQVLLTANRTAPVTLPTLPDVPFGLSPVLAWDNSNGPHRGRLYVTYQDLALKGATAIDGNLDVYLSWTDDGATWTEPIRVSDDSAGQQFLPTVVVDQSTGVLAAGWYDTSSDAAALDVLFTVATSADGGATFSRPQPVAQESSTPPGGKAKGPGDGPRMVFANRALHAVWADNSSLRLENNSDDDYEIATRTVGVIDVTPARVRIRPQPIAAVKGEAFNGTVATFTIADATRQLDELSASIEWGDGGKSNGAVSQPGGAGTPFTVTGSHAYGAVGAYPVWVTVADKKSGLQEHAVSNVTALQGSQSETSIAIDPRNPNRVFAASNDNSNRGASGMAVAKSDDGGVTWTSGFIGDGSDALPPARGDPKVAYDQFGNLFVTYLTKTAVPGVAVLLSENNGLDFRLLTVLQDATDSADQPSVSVGPGRDGSAGSVWLTWERGNSPFQVIMAAGAEVTGLGAVGGFQQHFAAPALVDGRFRNFGDIAIGSKGEVVLSYARGIAGAPGSGPSNIVVQTDPDGLGPLPFLREVVVTETKIGFSSPIAAQARNGIDAEGSLAWDRSGGEHNGRLYLVYTDARGPQNGLGFFTDTQLLLRYSEDNGLNWTKPIDVTDFDSTNAFFPAVAVDQSSGNLAVSWYTALGDEQQHTRYTATISDDGGVTWNRSAVLVAPGLSDASASTLDPSGFANQYGDYTGLSFVGGIVQPIWTDNSLELEGNPDPRRFEAANARIGVATVLGRPLVMQGVDIKGVAGAPVNAVLARFTDPEAPRAATNYKATIDWGDGTLLNPSAESGAVSKNEDGSFSVRGEHEYKTAGSYSVKVVVNAPHSRGETSLKAEIAKAQKSLVFAEDGKLRVVREVAFTKVLAVLNDANHNSKAADFDVTIAWGDGRFTDGVVALTTGGAAGASNVFSITGTHNYISEQTYAVQVSVRVKADGAKLTTSGAIVNGDPPMTLDITNDIFDALAGITVGDRILAVFTVDGDIQTDVGEYIATINWGDGTVDANVHPFVNRTDGVTVVGRHTYAVAGQYYASITVRDDSGNVATAPLVNTVEPGVTGQINAVGSGLVYDPARDLFVGELTLTNTSGSDIEGPLSVVLLGLPAGVTLESTDASSGAGDPLFKIDRSRLAAGASLEPIALEFSNPGRVPISYTVQVFEGGRARMPDGAALVFEPNRGQANAAASFIARGQGYAIGLSPAGASLLLGKFVEFGGAAASLLLVGANEAAQGQALEPQSGVSNYLQSGQAITGVPHFARVRYASVYTGIDIEYYGQDGVLEYDWVVHAGANADAIGFRFANVDSVRADNAGNLHLNLNVLRTGADLVLRAPLAYQLIGGVRSDVSAAFKLRADGSFGLTLGAYDASVVLVIDPVLVYSTYFGGSGIDPPAAVAVDAEGNTYLTGTTYSSDFFVVHPFDPELNDPGTPPFYFRPDAFITKLDPNGVPVYSSYLGGAANRSIFGYGSSGFAIAVDTSGRVWTTGLTDAETFPQTAAEPTGGLPHVPPDPQGIAQIRPFLTELAADGSALLYSTLFSAGSAIRDLALDGRGGLYATGESRNRVFVLKLDTTSHAVDYLTYLGGGFSFGIAADASGQAYLTGSTEDPNFPAVNALFPALVVPLASDSRDQLRNGFLSKLGSDGQVLFSTYYGGSGGETAYDIAVDPAGTITVGGQTFSKDLPVPGALQAVSGGRGDGFLLKFANDGSQLLYGTYIGGSERDDIRGVAVDGAGRVYFGGSTQSGDFPAMVRAFQPTYLGGAATGQYDFQEGFAGALEANGSALRYLTYIGGSRYDAVLAVAADAAGNASYVGVTTSPDLVTRQAAQTRLLGADTFIERILAQDDGAIALRNVPVRALVGTEFTGVVAAFTSNGTDTANQFSATIDWGDGASSAGSIDGDFHDGFRVLGTHLYATPGTRDLQVTLLDSQGRLVRSTGTTAGPAAADGVVHYRVSVDTTSLRGSSGLIGLEFNPGALPGSPDAQAVVRNLRITGGTLAALSLEGGASGDAAGEAVLRPVTVLNRLLNAVVFGSRIDFDLEISGSALSRPGGGNFADVFALQLLGADGRTPLLTADATASLLRIDVLPNGTTRSRSAGAEASVAALGQANVSRPSTQLNLTVLPFATQEGQAYAGAVGSFTSSDRLQTAAQFSAIVDWGDGTTPTPGTVSGAAGRFALAGNHTYANPGTYRLAITLVDTDGSAVFQRSPLAGAGFLEASPAPLATGNQFQPPLIADLNGDGLLDVVAADWLTGRKMVVRLGLGDFRFGDPIDLPTATSFSLLFAAGDFNGDGRIDLVAANQDPSGARSVSVLLGDGSGHFSAGPAATVIAPSAVSIATADLDEDGRLDVIIGSGFSNGANLPGRLLVLRGRGDGSFQDPVTYSVGSGNISAAVADVNRDGHVDLVVGGTFGSSLRVLLGDGTGALTPLAGLPVSALGFFTVMDVNADSVPDIVAADGDLAVFIGQGDGTFRAERQSLAQPPGSIGVAADLDGDGRAELVYVEAASGALNVLRAGADGRFAIVDTLAIALGVTSLGATDWNGDGKLDVTIAVGTEVRVVIGRGDGTLIAPDTLLAPQLARAVIAVDTNGDGRLDLVSGGSGGVSVQLNQGGSFDDPARILTGGTASTAVMLGDINGDGREDIVTGSATGISVLLRRADGSYAPPVSYAIGQVTELALGDINGDGALDIAASVPANGLARGVSGAAILLNDGRGGLVYSETVGARTGLGTGSGPGSVLLRDLNGDGKADLVVRVQGDFNGSTFVGGGLAIALSGGNRFGAVSVVPAGIDDARARSGIAAGDLNGDGHIDLVTIASGFRLPFPFGTPLNQNGLFVLLGNGDGSFRAGASYLTDGLPNSTRLSSVALADLNGDGRLDIAAARNFNFTGDRVDDTVVLLGAGDGSFGPAATYDGAAEARQLGVADLNGDGVPDLVINEATVDPDKAGVNVLLGVGDGSFGRKSTYYAGDTRAFAVGDLDGDGKSDVLASVDLLVNGTKRGELAALGGRGDGTLKAPLFSLVGRTFPVSLTPVDFNGDAYPDLAVAWSSTNEVGLLIGRGDGSFELRRPVLIPDLGGFPSGSGPKEVTLADIDGDGRAEFVVALSTSGAIVSVPLDNTGNAGTPVYRNAGLGFNDLSAFGDFNSDGVVDVVNVHRVFGTDQGLAVVLRGRGNGSFAASAAVAVGAETQAVVAGDLNNDGHLDLVFSNAGVRDSSLNYNGSLTVMLGNGDGTFKTPVAVAQSQPFGALALVDLNGDGFLDIAAVQGGSSRSEQRGIAVLLNRKDGRFAAPTLYDANVTSNITLNVLLGADLARDGAPELVFAEGSRDGLLRIVQNRAAQAGVVVRNAPLAVTGATINPVAGVAFSALIGTLRDDNPLAPAARHSASIDWGDGVTSAAMITADGQGGFSLTGSHLYATAGVRTIVIAAADSEGGNASGSGRAIVAATDLPLTAEGRAVEAMAGIPFDGVVTRFSDADPNGSASDFHARINWGDGTDTAGQVVAAAGGGFVVRGLHVYDAVGAYSVSVRITDLGGSTAATTSQATVGRLPNRAPIALDDRIVTPEDTPVAFDVRRNDSDPDRELLQVEVVEGPSHGSLEQLADGSFIYRPALNQVQSDSFRYRVRDAAGASAQARVDIELTPLNDAPTLAPIDDQRLAVGQTLSLQVQASDPDAGDSLRFTLDQAPAGATIDSSGRIRWVADGSAGTASFIVRVTDTAGAAATRAFEAVTGAPPPPSTPVASDDVAATAEDAPVTINVLANDSAAEGQVLSVAIVTGPAHGTALLNPEGTITYTPAANYFGSDSFTYRVSDGQAQSNEARVDITIGARNDAPTLAAITDATVMEGQSLSFQVVAFDVEGDALSYAVTGAGAVIDPTGRFSFAALDGDSSHPFTVRVSDGQSFAERSFTVTVANVAPTLGVTGAANVLGGTPYTLNLAATDPGVDTINAWLVNWGDGVSDALSGTATQASHLYSRAGGAFTIHASATDEDGSTNAAPLDVTVTPDLLDVQSFTATATGFKVRFDHAFDASTINLYDPAGGPADVALKGDLTGTVTGSLLFHADRQGISFIRSGGILQFDSYNVRLASGPAGFHDAISALDGNQDGTPGDDYLMRFDFRSTGAGVLSLPDFMRGPGQPVDVPAVGKLLPVTFTSAGGMRNMVFTVDYDPRLLNITGANAAANLPPDTEVRFDTQLLGTGSQRARITVILPGQTTLAAGATRLIDLVANVPASARYGAKQVLDIAVQSINGSAALPGSVADDDALHVVGYFGDTSGNAAYSTLDGQMVQRVMVKLDPGFAAWANVDPLLVADITGDGKLNSLDATRLLQEVSYLTGASTVDRLEIPPIPPGIGPISFSGPDPVVDIPRDLVGAPGDVVTLPVRLDTAAGLESVQLRMGYDASQFELVQVRRGTLTEDFGWFVVGNTPGQINVDMTRLTALQGGSGTLLNVDLRILPGATAGAAGIDLQYARLNDGHLTLNTEPQVGGDASDGRINIRANTPVAAQTTLAMSEVELPPTETPASEALLPDLAAFQTPPSVHLTAAVPVIDFGAAPAATAALPGLALATTSKPWLKDYLNNAGQATKVSPNLGLRVTIPMAASASFMASSRG